jgi:hypothetical protein
VSMAESKQKRRGTRINAYLCDPAIKALKKLQKPADETMTAVIERVLIAAAKESR